MSYICFRTLARELRKNPNYKVKLSDYVSRTIAAKWLSLHPETIKNMLQRGTIPSTKRFLQRKDGEWFVAVHDIVRMAKERNWMLNFTYIELEYETINRDLRSTKQREIDFSEYPERVTISGVSYIREGN